MILPHMIVLTAKWQLSMVLAPEQTAYVSETLLGHDPQSMAWISYCTDIEGPQ
jgi:hypothetical protein